MAEVNATLSAVAVLDRLEIEEARLKTMGYFGEAAGARICIVALLRLLDESQETPPLEPSQED